MKDLPQLYTELLERVDFLMKENIALRKETALLKAEIIRLNDRLGLNSKNSSIPSSKDLYKIKKANKKKSDKKPGGQPGHKGHKRDKMTANETVTVELDSLVCECGGEIRLNEPHIHQKIEIPEIKPHVTEYHMERGRCRSCGKRKSSKLPEGVTDDLFGPRTKSIISSLTGFYKNSKREVESILNDVFNLKISLGTISNNERRVSKKCKDNYENIELELSYSKMLHIDETSHYTKGKLGWCWLFSNLEFSLVKLADTRSKKVLEASVFGPNDSIIVTDRYAAYNYFSADNRQLCWSHLLRDFERFANSGMQEVKSNGECLRQMGYEVFALKKALLSKQIDILRFLRRTRRLRERMWYYLKEIRYLSNAKQASGVAKNMMQSEIMMWKFLEDPINIPLTNNHAERQIRHYVTYRKNSYFTPG
jgi:transposase